jgi:hypothetical protein
MRAESVRRLLWLSLWSKSVHTHTQQLKCKQVSLVAHDSLHLVDFKFCLPHRGTHNELFGWLVAFTYM